MGFGDYTCNWGTHICGLYETDAERDDIIVAFLRAGLTADDVLAFVPEEGRADAFKKAWANRFPQDQAVLATERVALLSPRAMYYPNGSFSPWAMEDALSAFYASSQAGGHRCIRSAARMAWALERIPGVEHLMAYEARLNFLVPCKPWVTICMYDVNRFSGSVIMKVLQTHPFCISGRVITKNPFYVDPATWLAAHAPQFLERPARLT